MLISDDLEVQLPRTTAHQLAHHAVAEIIDNYEMVDSCGQAHAFYGDAPVVFSCAKCAPTQIGNPLTHDAIEFGPKCGRAR